MNDSKVCPVDSGEKWNYAALTLVGNRVALVRDFNRIAGPPTVAMAALQDEFIGDRLEPADMIGFARVCYGLISVTVRTGRYPECP